MQFNQPPKRINKPPLSRPSRYVNTAFTAVEVVDAIFDRIERVPHLAHAELKHFIWKKRMEGAAILFFILLLCFWAYWASLSQIATSSQEMQRVERSEQYEWDGARSPKPRAR